MKKILFLLASLLYVMPIKADILEPGLNIGAANEDAQHDKTVVEGRSWWYYSSSRGPVNHYDYEITIGSAVEIDGVEWHELRGRLHSQSADGGPTTFGKADCLLGMIREDAGKIYTRISYSEIINGNDGSYPDIPFMYMFLPAMPFEDDKVYEIEVCAYDARDTIHSFGHPGQNYSYTISQISDEIINGHAIEVYTPTWHDQTMNALAGHGRYARQIGWLNELFFLPYGSYPIPAYPYPEVPQLKYVTDPDGSIIYEGLGGTKLWEEYEKYSYLNSLIIESKSTVKWYNLQGIEVPKPIPGNIYIRRDGAQSEKVVY